MKRPIRAKGKGKTYRRSLEAARKRILDDAEYFIRKGGYWYRPHACGYTASIAEAGVFPGIQARGHLHDEITIVPVRDMVDEIERAFSATFEDFYRLSELRRRIIPTPAHARNLPGGAE